MLVQALILTRLIFLQSPKLDEPAHLLAGLVQLQTGDTKYFEVNPPLVRLAAAAIATLSPHEIRLPMDGDVTGSPAKRIEFYLDDKFMDANGPQAVGLLQLARIVPCFITLLGTWLCAMVASQLWGNSAGLGAAILFAFTLPILGYGAVLSMDVSSAVAMIGAIWLWWYEWHGREQPRILGLTVVFVLLTLIKFSLLILIGVLPLLLILFALIEHRRKFSFAKLYDRLYVVCAAGLLTLLVVNIVYGFDRFGWPLEDYSFYSRLGGGTADSPNNPWQGTPAGRLPVPLPAAVIIGIDEQKVDFERGLGKNYLWGQWSEEGWYSYYAWGLLTKLPEGFWLLLALCPLGFFSLQGSAKERWLFAYLVGAGVVMFILLSSQAKLSQHFRYSMPVVAVLCILATSIWATKSKALQLVGWCGLVIVMVTGLANHHRAISYFNYASGGPQNGSKILLHSSLDWGQELYVLREWITTHPDAAPIHLYLAHTGFDLTNIGIEVQSQVQHPLNFVPQFVPDGGRKLAAGTHLVTWQHVLDPDSPYYAYRDQVAERIGDCYVRIQIE